MPPVVPVEKRRRFHRLLREGYPIKHAAERAGVSYSWAKKAARGERVLAGPRSGDNPRPDQYGVGELRGPVPLDQLSPVARDCLEDFGRFRARYFGRRSTPWQIEAGHRIADLLATSDEEYLVVNVPPGGGKTTLFSHDIPAWLTCRDRTIRGLLGSHGMKVSAGLTGNLRDTLSRRFPMQAPNREKARGAAFDAEATLAGDYGTFRPNSDDGVWRREYFTVAQFDEVATAEKETTWTSFSYEAKVLGWRVNFASWDDLVTVSDLRNPEKLAQLFEWYDNEAETRIEPGGLFVLVGQRLGANDIYRHALDKKLWTDEIDMVDVEDADAPAQYHHIVYKAHYDELCTGRHKPSDPAWPDNCLLDPSRISWRKLRAAKASGNFATVFQQEDRDPASALVQKVWVNGGRGEDGVDYIGCLDKERQAGRLPEFIPGQTVRYVTCDPSPTNWWAVFDVLYVQPSSVEPLAGYRYVIDLARRKMTAPEFLDWNRAQNSWTGLLEEWWQRSRDQGHPITHVIVEANAAQRFMMQYEHFRHWSVARGVSIVPHQTQRNKADPTYGIQATLPTVFRHGRVRIPMDRASGTRQIMLPFITEATTFPESVTDDTVHAFWFGEYHLPQLVTSNIRVGSTYNDIPSWAKTGVVG